MSKFAARAGRVFERFGEPFMLNGTVPAKGFFQQLDTGRMHIYLDDTECAMLVRPGLFLVVPGSAPVSVGNTIMRDGRTYEVLKVSNQRIRSETIVKIVILG